MSTTSLLAQLLQRLLRFLASVHKKSLRPLGLFAFLGFLRRWISRKRISSRIAARDRHPLCRPPTLNNDEEAICGMNVPSHGPFDQPEGGGHSTVDMPYRSSSGGHLVPYSPTARRRYTRDHIPWTTGSQTSLHEEPDQMEPEPSHVETHSILRPSSRTSVRLHDTDHAQSPDSPTHVSHPPSPSHQTIVFAPEISADNPGPHTSSGYASHPHFGGSSQELHRSRSPASFVSNSQRSTSQQSQNSRASTGRASYREYHGPPVHPRSPAPSVRHGGYSLYTPSSSTLDGGRAEPNGFIAVSERLVASPSANRPHRPGEVAPAYVGPRFAPMSTIGVLRYDRSRVRNPAGVDHMIEGMKFGYPETPDIPDGWTAHRHPEGSLYFMHAESKTFTEVNVCDQEILEDIGEFKNFLLSELQRETEERGLFVPLNEIQLVLEPQRDENGVLCRYYFVNPSSRSLFWLDNWEGYEIFKDCLGVLSLPHKGLGIQAHYWWAGLRLRHTGSLTCGRSHWDLFPDLCIVTPELKNEVVGMILHATCDHLTSNRSSCPLNPEELKNHLSLVKEIDPHSVEMRRHCAIVIGRTMHIFYNNYFLNFHGEECARLNFDQTIHGWKYYPSFMMSTFAPLLFMTPVNNVRLLHRIFVDDIASKEKWNMFVTKLNGQLQETSVLATVLLNANVAFLPKQSGTGISLQQILIDLSFASSMASIILALVFMGHSRTEARNTPFEAAKFLHGLRHERHGLETLAVAYSLPHALLIWGMILFFAAFAVQWWVSGNIASRASVGSVMIVVALLVAWCIWIARDRNEFWWFQSDPNQIALEDVEPDSMEDSMSLLGRLRRNIYRGLIMPWAEKQTASHFITDNHEMQEAQGTRDSPNSVPGPLITVSQPA